MGGVAAQAHGVKFGMWKLRRTGYLILPAMFLCSFCLGMLILRIHIILGQEFNPLYDPSDYEIKLALWANDINFDRWANTAQTNALSGNDIEWFCPRRRLVGNSTENTITISSMIPSQRTTFLWYFANQRRLTSDRKPRMNCDQT